MVNELRAVREKWESNQFPQFVRSIRLDGLRAFRNAHIDLNFPVVGLAGENGTGKTTVLKALACAYEQQLASTLSYFPGKLFMTTPWDQVSGVTLDYSLKHGDSDRTVNLRKPTKRWRGMDRRPSRHVFLLDITQKMPIDALAGYAQIAKEAVSLSQTAALSNQMKQRLEWVMGRTYEDARFAFEGSGGQAKRVGVLEQAFGEYSQFHQGAGESSSLDLFRVFDGIPNNSLLLIDEIDASLHPKAQRRLVRTLLWLARIKTLQIVLTTHSQYILEELPPEARVLLMRGNAGIEVVYRASPEFALTNVDDKEHPELTLFVEDREAEDILRAILAKQDSELVRRTDIVTVGASNIVTTLGKLARANKLPYPAAGVLDGDETHAACLALPCEKAPERQVFEDLQAKSWPAVDERLGVSYSVVSEILEDAMRNPEHHEWTTFVGDKVRMPRNRVWASLVDIWLDTCVDEEKLEDLTEQVRQSLPAAS